MTHAVKSLIEFYAAVTAGKKNFEIRKFDRPYAAGDKMLLQEFDGNRYTGREYPLTITDVFAGEDTEKLGLKRGFCILSFELPASRLEPIERAAPVATVPPPSMYVGFDFPVDEPVENGHEPLTEFAKEVILETPVKKKKK